MIKSKDNFHIYFGELTHGQSLKIVLIPAAFFLLNGLFVHVLKTLGAATGFYALLHHFRQFIRLSSISALALLLVIALAATPLHIPKRTPFRQGQIKADLVLIRDRCPADSLVLADRSFGIILPVIQLSYRYLVGKEYFLNWQIANLEPGSPAYQRAVDVRGASLFISRSPTSKTDGKDTEGLIATLDAEKPDLIVFKKARLNAKIEPLFLEYTREYHGKTVIYVRNDTCASDV